VSFVDFVLEIHRMLARADMPHAFAGALALAYVADPRGTVDIDVNVFSPVEDIDTVLGVFAELDLRPEEDRARAASTPPTWSASSSGSGDRGCTRG
jgi:hypothetical protein